METLLHRKTNPAWPYWYNNDGHAFVLDDFGYLVPPKNRIAGLTHAREGLSEHLAQELAGEL